MELRRPRRVETHIVMQSTAAGAPQLQQECNPFEMHFAMRSLFETHFVAQPTDCNITPILGYDHGAAVGHSRSKSCTGATIFLILPQFKNGEHGE
jgi:hypothetical protein